MDWAKQLGMEDVLDDPKNIYNYASKETIENTSGCMVDPEFGSNTMNVYSRDFWQGRDRKCERRFEEGE